MADAPKILGTDSLKQTYPKLNQAIDNANEALNKSTTAETNSTAAVNTANQANEKADFTQTQLDQVAGASTIDPAVSQMKVDTEGFTHASPDARLRSDYDKLSSNLAQRAKDIENQFKLALEYVKDGFVVLIGDSITDGAGLAYADHYATKLFNYIKDINGNPKDMELTVNFESNVNFGKVGTWAINDNGAARKSIILQPGAGVYFDGDLKYLDILFKRTPASGKIAVYRGATVVKTIDCAGVDTDIVSSFPTATVAAGTAHYTLSCIDAPVELLGVIKLNTTSDKIGNTIFMRSAFSGSDTTDFSTDKVLADIKKTMNAISGTTKKNKLYIIGLGTNDIFSASKYKSSASFIANLEKMYTNLKEIDCDSRIVFTIPPISNTSLFPVRMETYNSYKDKIINLAKKYNCSVIDYSYIDFVANSLYQDGIHPNTLGTTAMVDHILKTLALGILRGDEKIVSSATLTTTSKVLANNANYTVPFDSATNDNLKYFDPALPTLVKIPVDGVYAISLTLEFAANASGRRVIMFKTGDNVYFGNQYVLATATGTTAQTITHIGYFKTSNSPITLIVSQNSGADLALVSAVVKITKL
jgi:lysophospholipase L1-like esterase